MKTLIVYDSLFGNTEKIAKAIGEVLALQGEARMKKATEANEADLAGVELLVLGSPTHGGRPSPAFLEFLKKIPEGALKGKKVAAFDTRFEEKTQNFILRLVMKIFKYAAPRLKDHLKSQGAVLVAEPEGFLVEGKEGPLKQGELERAAAWARGFKL